MQHTYIERSLSSEVESCLRQFPAVAVLGPRQCGKSTLARHLVNARPDSIYLDLERPSDLRKLHDPELFLSRMSGRLVCLDEIQRVPDIFPVLRSLIDERGGAGQFLILGSASRDLIRQSSETLAGRIAYLNLPPFTFQELKDIKHGFDVTSLWLRGGFPESVLARNDSESLRWRLNFIRTFLERDIAQLGPGIASSNIERFWQMCAHYHGQLLNGSQIAQSLGVSHPTIRSYLDLLAGAFVMRVLSPVHANLKKRLVKSPRIYVRDSGLLHALHGIESYEDLLGHPVYGHSWEGMVIENVLALMPGWNPGFYRTARGAEIDLVLEKGGKRLAFECKASKAPELARGFWIAMEDLEVEQAWVVAPVDATYPLAENVDVIPVANLQSSLVEFL